MKSMIQNLRENLVSLLQYSNCTPFVTKTFKGYKCFFCFNLFPNSTLLKAHTHQLHSNEKITDTTVYTHMCFDTLTLKVDVTNLTCNICQDDVNDIDGLLIHLKTNHNIIVPMKMKRIIIEFKFQNENEYKCVFCDKCYVRFKMLVQHMNVHYPNFICDTCGMSFINTKQLRLHNEVHNNGRFPCDKCDKVFSKKKLIKAHEKFTHNGVKLRVPCPNCDKLFTGYYMRNKHMVEVHGDNRAEYNCNLCNGKFFAKHRLTEHINRVHLDIRKEHCTECNMSFRQPRHLRLHMMTHTGERNLFCDVCQKCFARRSTLVEHMKIHNNDKRHVCDICNMRFIQKSYLKSHLLNKHCIE